MKAQAKKTILKIKPYVPGKPIEEVKRELGLKDVIKLASNENPYGPSKKVLRAIADAAKSLNRYPDGDCYYLRKELSKRLNLKPNQLIFGNGSDELIVLAIRAFVGIGDEVIMAQPSFLVYDIASRIAGANIKRVKLQDFRYDLTSMKKCITKKTKLIFLGNPDNPAGTFIPHKELKSFIKSVRKNILIFIDEAYFEYVNDRDYGDSLKLIKSNKNVIVTRTFSKMYGLAGLRVGYGMANEELIDILNRIREPFNINSLAQAGALACLKDRAYYRAIAKKIEGQRKYIYQSLEKLNLEYVPSCTNFILIKVKKNQATNIVKKLMKQGVIVRDMSFWGMTNYIRITIGSQTENRRLMKVLGQVI